MRNLLLTISYKGTCYHGWQVQENAVSVQEIMQNAIETVFRKRENLYGCSRTDSGVHANMYCCNFRTENTISCEKIPNALNGNLPRDISVVSCVEADSDFHARYSCKSKEYVYKIWNGKSRNPFDDGLYLNFPYKIDDKMLNEQCQDFVGTFDYASFCSSKSNVEDTTRTIYSCSVKRYGSEIIFTVKGNGFLYNMVRIMVGTLLKINMGQIEKDTIKEIIDSKNRNNAGFTAPPEGLYLNSVNY